MATNHTANYQLNQWEATDQVLRTDFNEDNSKLDTALKSLNTTAQEHAAQLSQLQTSLRKCGDCKLYYTTYVGNGQDILSLTFPQKPAIAFLYGDPSYNLIIFPEAEAAVFEGYGAYLSWSGNTLTMTNTRSNTTPNFNFSRLQYHLLALLDAGE